MLYAGQKGVEYKWKALISVRWVGKKVIRLCYRPPAFLLCAVYKISGWKKATLVLQNQGALVNPSTSNVPAASAFKIVKACDFWITFGGLGTNPCMTPTLHREIWGGLGGVSLWSTHWRTGEMGYNRNNTNKTVWENMAYTWGIRMCSLILLI